jgi:enoyl-CoA hydratase/carnithine racemase
MLTIDVRDAVALLRFDRPPANALDRSVFETFTTALASLERDAAVRAVVVTGEIIVIDGGFTSST